jgi:hypothetical protein
LYVYLRAESCALLQQTVLGRGGRTGNTNPQAQNSAKKIRF